MSHRPPLRPDELAERRRHARVAARRRRARAIDVAVGAALGGLVTLLTPGLAPLAIAGLIVLLVCLATLTGEALRARRRRSRPPDRPE